MNILISKSHTPRRCLFEHALFGLSLAGILPFPFFFFFLSAFSLTRSSYKGFSSGKIRNKILYSSNSKQYKNTVHARYFINPIKSSAVRVQYKREEAVVKSLSPGVCVCIYTRAMCTNTYCGGALVSTRPRVVTINEETADPRRRPVKKKKRAPPPLHVYTTYTIYIYVVVTAHACTTHSRAPPPHRFFAAYLVVIKTKS